MAEYERETEEYIRLMTRYHLRIYLFIRTFIPNANEAEEVMQETSLVLWRRFTEFAPGTDFRAWAFEVAFRTVQGYLGRKGRDRHRFDTDLLDTIALTASDATENVEARKEALAECIAKLSDKDRHLIQSRYQLGASIAEVAADVGRSVDAVYKAVRRIRRALYECIQRKLAAEEHP